MSYVHVDVNTKPADLKFLREKVVYRTVGCQINGSGCSVAASLMAKRTNCRAPEKAVYLNTHSLVRDFHCSDGVNAYAFRIHPPVLSNKLVVQPNLFGRQ